MTVAELTNDVLNVMADVLVHQRPRWGSLLGHWHQYEGWWKAEMALALESWAWRSDRLKPPMYVTPEAKPAAFHLEPGPPSADLLVAPMLEDFSDFAREARPRVWIELKERGTWWGTSRGETRKALGSATNSLRADLMKWKDVTGEGEVVVVCQITAHDGTYDECLAPLWTEELKRIEAESESDIGRSIKLGMSRCVGYELPGTREGKRTLIDRVRWAHFDAFIVNRGW